MFINPALAVHWVGSVINFNLNKWYSSQVFFILCVCVRFDAVPAVVLCGQMQVFLRSHTCVWVKDHFRIFRVRQALRILFQSREESLLTFTGTARIEWPVGLSHFCKCVSFGEVGDHFSYEFIYIYLHAVLMLTQFKSSNFSNNVSVKSYLKHKSKRSSNVFRMFLSQNRCYIFKMFWNDILSHNY